MIRKGKAVLLTLAGAAVLLLSGCYSGNADQYYSLPRASEEYLQLQSLIDREIASGSEYAAPTGGSYRQSVQLRDLDGNGENEALAFFRDENKNLKIVIYALSDGEYAPVLTLHSEGSAIGRVDYADLERDGLPELVVSWQIGPGMNLLCAYNLTGWGGEQYLSTDCAEFLLEDLNRDGLCELLVIRAASSSYMADMYSFAEDGEPRATTASLSADISTLLRVRSATLSDGIPALVVESSLLSGDLVSDICISRDGSLVNLTMNRATGISGTARSYSLVYAQDINSDGTLEIPLPQQLYSEGGEVFWSVAWYAYDSTGRTKLIMTTYHCFTDGWYLVLPSGWETGLTVRRNDSVTGEHSLTLCRIGTDGSTEELLTIFTLSGENRNERARLTGRFVLQENESTVFAGYIHTNGVSQETIRGLFHIIYSEWSTGSV